VLGEFTGEQKTNGSLDLTRGDGRPLVVVSEATGLGRDALEDVVDEGVHDTHGLRADAGIRVDLLQDLVDVDGVGLLPLAILLPGSILADGSLGALGSFLLAFSGNGLGWHDDVVGGKLRDFRQANIKKE